MSLNDFKCIFVKDTTFFFSFHTKYTAPTIMSEEVKRGIRKLDNNLPLSDNSQKELSFYLGVFKSGKPMGFSYIRKHSCCTQFILY